MLYFSSLLKNPPYTQDADMLFFTLRSHGEDFCLFDGGKNIWARDYMPIRNHKGELLSFRYSPSYMADCPAEYTNYRTDIRLPFPTRYSSINLDGGNAVFSPSSVTGSFPKTRNGIGKHWKKSFQNCWTPELSSSNPCPLTSLGMPMEWCGFCLKILF